MTMMKKFLLVVLILLPMGIFAQELKIAHVNIEEIFSQMPEVEKGEADISKATQQYRAQLEGMKQEYDRKYADFMQSDSLAESIKAIKLQELRDIDERMNNLYSTAQQEIEKMKRDLQTAIFQKIIDATKSVGQEQGYTYIHNTTQLLYFDPKAIDATNLVKAKLGLK